MIPLLALMVAQQIGAGQVLIATRKSHDPELKESVVLLIHSDRDGAIGLILNRPRDGVYFGGPIALGARALFRWKKQPANAEHIFGDVFVVSKKSAIPAGAKARVYAGYVGWSAQQLAGEIALGLWKITRIEARTVFDPHPETLWQRLSR